MLVDHDALFEALPSASHPMKGKSSFVRGSEDCTSDF